MSDVTAHIPVSMIRVAAPATFAIPVDATGGTWTVSVDGVSTGNLAFNVSAADLETAVAALATVGAGNVEASGGPGQAGGGTPYFLKFVGTLAGLDITVATADALTGGAGTAVVTETQAGEFTDLGSFLGINAPVVP